MRPVALFSHKRNRVKSLHSDRDDKFLTLRAVQRENEALSKLSASENRTRVHLEEQEDQLLSVPEAKNLKQECRREFADSNTRELNSQIQSQRMEIDHTNTWFEQSRKNKPDFTKKWQDEKVDFKKLISKVILFMSDLKRVEALRVDEFARRLIENDLIFGIRLVYLETFVLVHLHLFRLLTQECFILGILMPLEISLCKRVRGDPVA